MKRFAERGFDIFKYTDTQHHYVFDTTRLRIAVDDEGNSPLYPHGEIGFNQATEFLESEVTRINRIIDKVPEAVRARLPKLELRYVLDDDAYVNPAAQPESPFAVHSDDGVLIDGVSHSLEEIRMQGADIRRVQEYRDQAKS